MNYYLQTRSSEYGGRVHGDRHIPSSAPVISNASSPPDISKATSVAQTSSSFSEKTPLPKPALVSPAPLQPPDKTLSEKCKVDYHRPRMLEQDKNDEKHLKNKRVCEELVRMIHGKQSAQVRVSQLNLEDHPKKVLKSKKNRCSTQDIASGFMNDNNTRGIQLHSNVENISEVPAEAPEGKSMKKRGKYMGTNDGSKQPANSVSVRNDLCDVKSESQFVHKSNVAGRNHLSNPRHRRDDHILRREDKHISPSKDKHILRREDKRAVSGKLLRPRRLNRSDINARSKAKRVKGGGFSCKACRVHNLSKHDYYSHINGSVHFRKVKYCRKRRVACLKQAVSDAINNQVQRGDGNSVLFAELLTTVLSKQFTTHTSVDGHSYKPRLLQNQVSNIKACAKIPASTTMAGPSSEPQLLQTQAPEIQAHVEIEDSSGKTKTELAVDAEILAAPTSMAGPSYEAQLLQSQVSEIKARVEMENPSRETKPGLVVAAEILPPPFMTGPSCEPQLMRTQVSDTKAQVSESKKHVDIENLSDETKTVACPTEVKKTKAGASVSPQSGEGSESEQQL